MLFKFASYLLGTNNDSDENRPEQQQLDIESNVNTQDSEQSVDKNSSQALNDNVDETLSIDEQAILNKQKKDLIEEDDYMYAEQLINCSKLKNSSNCELDSIDSSKDDHLCDQLEEDEDCDDDQWIYITPIKRKNEDEKTEISEEEFANEPEDEDENCILVDEGEKTDCNPNVPTQEHEDDQEKEKFNFYDYFNNKSELGTLNEEPCSAAESAKLSPLHTNSRKLVNHKLQQSNRMEESWVIHPPACFQVANTFSIEESPLENLYIENPVMASCKIDKENNGSTSLSTNSSSILNKSLGTANRILVDRNNMNNQPKASVACRKSMRKRANSTRKTNKKQIDNNKKSKNQSKRTDQSASSVVEQQKIAMPVEQHQAQSQQQTKAIEGEQRQVLNDRQEKQLLAQYLTMNPSQLIITPASNTIASSSNSSTHQSPNSHPHNHHHFISNNCVSTFNSSTNAANATLENKKSSKSLRRTNKIAMKRDKPNKPFTLHRKLC